MDGFIRELVLPNGLIIFFFNQTRRYFGDFHLVKLEIVCKVPVIADHFKDESEFADVRAVLGDEVVYRRIVEQMGVPSTEIERVLNRLMADFEKHSLPYFSAAAFPRKIICAELAKIRGKKHHLPTTRFQP